MARIDSILSIVVQQGANELRVAFDREPKMLAFGVPKRLSIPKMSGEMVRELLGEILSTEAEAVVRARGRHEAAYDAGAAGVFQVTLTSPDADAIEAVFVRASVSPAASTTAPPRPTHIPATRPESPVALASHGSAASLESLASLVARASSMRASDLHLADGDVPFARVDGRLRRFDDAAAVDVATTLALGDHEKERLAQRRSVDLGMEIEGVGRIRVHAYATAEGLVAAVRLLPPAAPSFSSLHMPIAFDDLITLPHGLVLVCGATGSGKSTTLAALAQEALQRRSIVLVTLEDPIEYAMTPSSTSLVRRRQVGRDVADFASGLRDALREDPDVLLVGEMRDPETIALALTAAETGHLVLASLHSRSGASAVERIVDAYPPERQQQIRVQLADSLRAIVSQRLLPRARGSGRLPAIEMLRVNHAVAAMIREGKTAQIATAVQSGRSEGMLSLDRCLADRVKAGEVRAEDARAVADDPSALAMYLAR